MGRQTLWAEIFPTMSECASWIEDVVWNTVSYGKTKMSLFLLFLQHILLFLCTHLGESKLEDMHLVSMLWKYFWEQTPGKPSSWSNTLFKWNLHDILHLSLSLKVQVVCSLNPIHSYHPESQLIHWLSEYREQWKGPFMYYVTTPINVDSLNVTTNTNIRSISTVVGHTAHMNIYLHISSHPF